MWWLALDIDGNSKARKIANIDQRVPWTAALGGITRAGNGHCHAFAFKLITFPKIDLQKQNPRKFQSTT
jgi:hypothetical protein